MRLLEDHPKRMARERQLLEEHASSSPVFSLLRWRAFTTGELCVDFNLKLVGGVVFPGTLVYPELFPDVPAFIRPQKAGQNWSSHQFTGAGVLCLQWGPDNWHREVSGLDLVLSANTLLWGELMRFVAPEIGPVPSRHEHTDTPSGDRLLVPSALKQLLADSAQPPMAIEGVVDWLGAESVAIVLKAGTPLKQIAAVPTTITDGPGLAFTGFAVAVPSVASLINAKSPQDLHTLLGSLSPWAEGISQQLQLLYFHDIAGQVCSFLLADRPNPIFKRYQPLPLDSDDAHRLPQSFSALSTVSVAIVGLGSLGSKVAVSLARAGVRKFVLVDDDLVMPGNLVRNEFDWLDVGFSKLAAATRALKLIAPGVQVTTWPIRIASQGNPSVAAMVADAIAACTLVVDATADSAVFVTLAALAKRAKVAYIWGEVFGGGGGALMARSRPGLDVDALGVRAHLHGVMEGMAPAPKARATAYGLETDGTVYVASDADVSSLAASMTQFCLDALCSDQTEYPASAYLIGFRKFWEFKCPFDVIPVICPSAALAATETPLTDNERRILEAMQKAVTGGASAASHSAA